MLNIYYTPVPLLNVHLFQVRHIAATTYFTHARKYLNPLVISTWRAKQSTLLQEAREIEGGMSLQGDGRLELKNNNLTTPFVNTVKPVLRDTTI